MNGIAYLERLQRKADSTMKFKDRREYFRELQKQGPMARNRRRKPMPVTVIPIGSQVD